MRDNFDRYEKAGVAIYGINPAGAASHDEYCAMFGFPFALVVDQGAEIARQYGALKENGRSIQRAVFLVADGVIRFAREGAPSSDEILAALAPTA